MLCDCIIHAFLSFLDFFSNFLVMVSLEKSSIHTFVFKIGLQFDIAWLLHANNKGADQPVQSAPLFFVLWKVH